ncbi:hypothetical protein ACJ41O_006573 [Fusarium nematophilum]
MKVTPTSLSLTLALRALEEDIYPHLPVTSLAAQSSYKGVVALVCDLLARCTPTSSGTTPLVEALLKSGATLARDMNAALKPSQAPNIDILTLSTGPTRERSFQQLAYRYEELTKHIDELAQKLAASPTEETPLLLRRAAEWEATYYRERGARSDPTKTSYYENVDLEPTKAARDGLLERFSESRKSEPSAVDMQSFLRSSRSDPSITVTRLKRLAGGHGKQTYVCEVCSSGPMGNDTAEVVIRKEDRAPIICRSTFRVAEEFALLKDLSTNTDFPCPRPFDLADPAPEGIDAPFYTMSRMKGAIGSMYLGSESSEIDDNMAQQLATLLAKLHTYPLDKFSSYFQTTGQHVDQIKRMSVRDRYRQGLKAWTDYVKDVEHLPSPFMTWLLHWLQHHVPDDPRPVTLTHGDFSIHNLLQVDGEITGVLDWECADFLSPEQDLAYLQPLLSKTYPWDRFIQHYLAAGGPAVHEEYFPFAQAYASLRTIIAFNRATRNILAGDSRDFRFLMVEYGYQGPFMDLGLEYSSQHPSYMAIAKAAASIDTLESLAEPPVPVPRGLRPSVKPDGHGRQDHAFDVRGGEVNIRQPNGLTLNWQDSVVLVWWDAKQRIGGFHRLGHEPNRPGGGEAIIWTNLITPAGMFKRVQSNRLREADTPSDGSHGSGDDTCTVRYANGEHVWNINEAAEGITARIVHRDTGPNVDCFPKRGSMNEDFATAHFDVPGRVTGELEMAGHTYDIDGLSIRDHAWGNRDWGDSAYGHRWLVGTAGEQFSFIAVSWHATAGDRVANFGWLVRGGAVTLARETDILVFMEVDSCTNRGGRLKMVLTTGEELDIEIEAAAPKASVCWHLGMACVDRICTFRCKQNGVQGFANVESTSNIQFGARRPGTLVGGVIENGFTPT